MWRFGTQHLAFGLGPSNSLRWTETFFTLLSSVASKAILTRCPLVVHANLCSIDRERLNCLATASPVVEEQSSLPSRMLAAD